MKTVTQLKRALLSSCLLFSLGAYAQTQQTKTEVPTFSSDAEKQQWINSHPEEYSKAGGDISKSETESKSPVTPEFTSQAEKDAWLSQQKQVEKAPAETKDDAAANKEATISTEAEKDAYLDKHPNTVYITQEEFNALPEGKKAAVLADKKFVIIK